MLVPFQEEEEEEGGGDKDDPYLVVHPNYYMEA